MSEEEKVGQGKVVHLDPLNPPVGVLCLAIICTFDKETKQPIVDVQGHIHNEQIALELLDRARLVLMAFHKQRREAVVAEAESVKDGKNKN